MIRAVHLDFKELGFTRADPMVEQVQYSRGDMRVAQYTTCTLIVTLIKLALCNANRRSVLV